MAREFTGESVRKEDCVCKRDQSERLAEGRCSVAIEDETKSEEIQTGQSPQMPVRFAVVSVGKH